MLAQISCVPVYMIYSHLYNIFTFIQNYPRNYRICPITSTEKKILVYAHMHTYTSPYFATHSGGPIEASHDQDWCWCEYGRAYAVTVSGAFSGSLTDYHCPTELTQAVTVYYVHTCVCVRDCYPRMALSAKEIEFVLCFAASPYSRIPSHPHL